MNRLHAVAVIAVVLIFANLTVSAKDPKPTPQEVIQKSLDAIGTKDARTAAISRQLTGTVKLKQLSGRGFATIEGLVSLMTIAPNQTRLQMKFNSPGYLEDMKFGGENVEVAYIQPGIRSRLGRFMYDRGLILRQGLLGGPLSAATPLEDPEGHQSKLTYDGLKKIDDRQLHQLSFIPKKNPDGLVIKLFFDQDFRHVMTRYSWTPTIGMGANETESARMQQGHSELEERFADFRSVGALSLPLSYEIRFSSDEATGSTSSTGSSNYVYQITFDHYNKAEIPTAGPAAPIK